MPGLHGDEAWAGLRAATIVAGARPIVGMNYYTGALHQYLVAGTFVLFGTGTWTLRFPSVVGALLTLACFAWVAFKLLPRTQATLSVVFLAISPFFLIYSRIAMETLALNPLLAVAAMACLIKGIDEAHAARRFGLLVGAGTCVGMGIWTHFIFVSVIPPLLLFALVRSKGRVVFSTAPLAVALGLGLGLLPRVVQAFRAHESAGAAAAQLATSIGLVSRNIREWPGLYLQLAEGDLIFQRHFGDVVMPSPHIVAAAFAIAAVLLLNDYRKLEFLSLNSKIAAFTALLFVCTMVISPENSDRYFLLPLFLTPVILATAIVAVYDLLKPWRPTLAWLVVLLAVVWRAGYFGVNFFGAEPGGKFSTFNLGRQLETSNHFVSTDELYAKLVALNVERFSAEFFISQPLQFLDLGAHHFRHFGDGPRAGDDFAVVYASGMRQFVAEDFVNFEIVNRDAKFLILRRTR